MKALVFNGVGQMAFEDRPKLQGHDSCGAIVRLMRTTTCGVRRILPKISYIFWSRSQYLKVQADSKNNPIFKTSRGIFPHSHGRTRPSRQKHR
ncbi:hypothetical protein WAI453_003311 [Rhynchosporium graminicola]